MMELRGIVLDPHGEAACDTSGYHPTIVQLFGLGDGDDVIPLSKREALCGVPLAVGLAAATSVLIACTRPPLRL